MKLITIKSFELPMEAHLLKSKLEFNEIKCFLKDEFTVESNHLYSKAVGGVKLQVFEADLEKALKVMKETGEQIAQNSEGVCCIKCDSKDVEKGAVKILNSKGLMKEIHHFFGGILPFLYKTTYYCVSCHTRFNPQK